MSTPTADLLWKCRNAVAVTEAAAREAERLVTALDSAQLDVRVTAREYAAAARDIAVRARELQRVVEAALHAGTA